MKDIEPGYAIVRIDRFQHDVPDEDRMTVERVVWDETVAQAEVDRLNALTAGDDAVQYFWQYTRVDRR